MALGIGLIVAEFFMPAFGSLGVGGLAAFVIGSIILFENHSAGALVAMPLIVGIAVAGGLVIVAMVWLAAGARRRPLSTGVETMIGATVEAVNDCRDRSVVRFWRRVVERPHRRSTARRSAGSILSEVEATDAVGGTAAQLEGVTNESVVTHIVFVALLLVVISSIRILKEYERGVMFTLGRFTGVKGPGVRLVLPALIQQMKKVELRIIVLNVPKQDVISRDNVSVKVSAVVYFRIVDGKRPFCRSLIRGKQPVSSHRRRCVRCADSTKWMSCWRSETNSTPPFSRYSTRIRQPGA